MLQPSKDPDIATSASKRRDDQFAEAVTGWATNFFFPLPKIPNHYISLPWRRIFKSRGSLRGALFIARVLATWPFELALEIARPSNVMPSGDIAREDYPSQFSHGDHVCHLYQTNDSLLHILSPFIAEGLKKGERCFCVQTPPVREKLCAELLSIGIDVDREIGRGALMFQSEEELYFGEAGFDVPRLLDRLGQLITDSLESGFTGLRTAGDMSRAFSDPALRKQIVQYERAVDEFYADKKAIAFCNYRLDGLSRASRAPVIEAHGFHIMDSQAVGAA
jgi:MEDS: MEthanogen/methylotroph, DcmR Sensory domain